MMQEQSEFNFQAGGSSAGFQGWITGRKMAAIELAKRIHLPLGHQVEVWLYGGIRLRGLLRLKDEVLFIEEAAVRHVELVVDNVPFTIREMESCVRTD